MKEKTEAFKVKYRRCPAWYWLLFTVFSFSLLPEYVSPFVLFVSFLIFKSEWSKEGRLAKVGNIGKIEMVFMGYMLVSALWSPTKLDTLGSAGLWWAVILIQVMIFNLARTKERIRKLLAAMVASACVNGAVGAVQLVTFILAANGRLPQRFILTTPFYRNLDYKVYTMMPFAIGTDMWKQRASGFYSNPNLLCTCMIVAFPLAIYLFLNAKSRKEKAFCLAAFICLSAGMASTLTRAGCYIMLLMWLVLFVLFIRRYAAKLLLAGVPVLGLLVPSVLIRYGKIRIYFGDSFVIDGLEAAASSEAHFNIWKSMVNYITHHLSALLIGTGFGLQRTGEILYNLYNLKKPHSHNFVIEIWAELGIVGILMLAFIIAYAVGKLLEIKTGSRETLTLCICVLTSFAFYFVFGLSDYIFNSPKQIVFFMMLIGLIQAISYVYEKKEIQTRKDLVRIAGESLSDLIHQ